MFIIIHDTFQYLVYKISYDTVKCRYFFFKVTYSVIFLHLVYLTFSGIQKAKQLGATYRLGPELEIT